MLNLNFIALNQIRDKSLNKKLLQQRSEYIYKIFNTRYLKYVKTD